MKRLFLIAGLATAFLLLVVAASAQKANFAGTWLLDKAKSQNLSQRLQGADKVTLTITQDDKTISLETKVEGGQQAGAGAGAGGGTGGGAGTGGGGGGGMRPGGGGGPQSFNLDGKEVTGEQPMGQSTAKKTTKTTMSGDALELMTKLDYTGRDGNPATSTTTQKLALSDGGKTLTMVTHREGGPQQAPDVTAVYTKQ
jgi:hypothetical protein